MGWEIPGASERSRGRTKQEEHELTTCYGLAVLSGLALLSGLAVLSGLAFLVINGSDQGAVRLGKRIGGIRVDAMRQPARARASCPKSHI